MLAQIVVLVAVLKLLASKIFFGRVLENAALASGSSYWEFFKYLLDAFFQTHFAIQIAILLALGVGALLWRDFARVSVSYFRTFQK